MSKTRQHPKNYAVKLQLFLKCGTIDMYDMRIYERDKLTLHHYPPFRETHHTIFSESYLVTRPNHDYIESLDQFNQDEYQKVMRKMKDNKLKLIRDKNKQS